MAFYIGALLWWESQATATRYVMICRCSYLYKMILITTSYTLLIQCNNHVMHMSLFLQMSVIVRVIELHSKRMSTMNTMDLCGSWQTNTIIGLRYFALLWKILQRSGFVITSKHLLHAWTESQNPARDATAAAAPWRVVNSVNNKIGAIHTSSCLYLGEIIATSPDKHLHHTHEPLHEHDFADGPEISHQSPLTRYAHETMWVDARE